MMGCFAMRVAVAAIIVAVGKMAMLGLIASAAVIPSAAIRDETMPAPAMSVAPASPGSDAQEDAVVEVPGPIKASGRAAVRRGFVIAPCADGRNANIDCNMRNTDGNGNLCASRRRQSQA